MIVENKTFKNFKSYGHFKSKNTKGAQENLPHQQKANYKPLIGSALGVGAALLVSSKLPKKENVVSDVAHTLLMAGTANVGGVLAGSIGATKKQKEKKWKEAGFQVMNISIPMVMVASAVKICDSIKGLNKTLPKAIASIGAMITGAMIATAITNATREEGEPYRKYTPKDAIANFDDIIMTIKLGFKNILNYVPVDKILPFIYIYSGARAGEKE